MENLEREEKNGLKGIEIRSTVKSLGKDDFLKLLITQLSSQDPTNPVKDQDFIAQMAQFSSLEQMNNISTGIQKMGNRQSFSLVGKLVSGPDFVTGESVSGIAGALFFDGEGKTFVRVNGRSIDVEQISLISDPVVLKEQEAAYNHQSQSQQPAPVQTSTHAPEIGTSVPSQESPVSTVSPNASQTEIEKKKRCQQSRNKGKSTLRPWNNKHHKRKSSSKKRLPTGSFREKTKAIHTNKEINKG
ncbi:putative flagellar hook capping protein [Leptospira alexanderi serovar Manhao 3 str. L 60]|uniref:Basal-body rod modification protein FlgD n=1 Tax=Leptospira alexanderi serovar Manhao 3 str. L 60 TaxID=1049759 RepID=V6HY22_9LEPT|nr:putative flagellar hook capping protein [Leptospira alexanderi serovar Manhao 3 str. L 60]